LALFGIFGGDAGPEADTDSTEVDDGAIFEQRVAVFVAAVPMALLAGSLSAAVLAVVLYGKAPTAALAAWLAAVLVLTLVRWLDHRSAASTPVRSLDRLGLTRRLHRTQAGVLLSAVLWSATTVFLFPAGDIAAQAMLTVVLAGLSAGVVNTFSAFLGVSRLFLALALVPLMLRMALTGTETGFATAALAALYLMLMLSIAGRNHDALMHSLRTGRARELAEAAMMQHAYYDSLTSLPNRRLVADRLELAIARHLQTGNSGALLLMDIDRFQLLNNSLARGAGDRLLRLVAGRLSDLIGGLHNLGRLDGDRFVVILAELGDSMPIVANRARHEADNLRRVLAVPLEVDGREVQLSVSVGIALFPGDGDNPDDLIRAAESALAQAKVAGRDCARFFLPQMQAAAKASMDLEVALRRALRKGELRLHYQPQVDREGRIIAVEALLRWPRDGAPDIVASPGVFVPMAEDSGMIHELGEWVITEALRDLRRLEDVTGPQCPQRLALNVSPVQFRQADFAGALASRLLTDGLSPQRLELELTERVLVADFQDISRKMGQLRDLGVYLSVDDFGTGYSSLSYLKRLPLHALKIDRSFVRDVTSNLSDAAIVETIVEMAHRLGLRVVAKGVDNPAVKAFLEQKGCDGYQGFLLHRPMPFDNLVSTLLGGPGTAGQLPRDARPVAPEPLRDLLAQTADDGAGSAVRSIERGRAAPPLGPRGRL
jgi:diguanylate cyclase (GGDEF)-like protein